MLLLMRRSPVAFKKKLSVVLRQLEKENKSVVVNSGLVAPALFCSP